MGSVLLLAGFELHIVPVLLLAQPRAGLHPKAFGSPHSPYLHTSGSESQAVRSPGKHLPGDGVKGGCSPGQELPFSSLPCWHRALRSSEFTLISQAAAHQLITSSVHKQKESAEERIWLSSGKEEERSLQMLQRELCACKGSWATANLQCPDV